MGLTPGRTVVRGGALMLAGLSLAMVPRLSRAQPTQRWRLVEEWRVGGAEDGPHSLGDVRGLGVLRNGTLVVLDAKDQQVHFLDARGRPLRTVGRKGAGPGEFTNANGLVVTPADEVVVNDPGTSRFTVLSSSGDLRRTITLTNPWGYQFIWDAFVDPAGRLDEFVALPTAEDPGRGGRRRWSNDFKKLDTLRTLECNSGPRPKPEETTFIFQNERGGRYIQVPHMFPHKRTARSNDGGAWTGGKPRDGTLEHRPAGQCEADVTIHLQGRPVHMPDAVRDSSVEMVRKAAREFGAPSPDVSRIPRDYPLFDAIYVDVADQLWVERFVEGGDLRFEVYSRAGALRATLARSTGFDPTRPVVLGRDRIYAFTKDEDDVMWLVSLRIMRG